MKIWTYSEMKAKLERDLDLEDEIFVKPDELIGYFNEALTEAEAEILTMNQEYFLTKYYVPFVAGTSRYSLPSNIFATKIRGFMYQNGAVVYPIFQIRRRDKFESIALMDLYGQADDYQYLLVNDYPGQAVIEIHPVMRDTAILSPVSSLFTPGVLWFLRNCARVPLTGEYCNPEILALTQISASANTIQTYAGTSTVGTSQQGLPGSYPGSIAYVTGDAVKLTAGPNGTVPDGLTDGTVYYVIAQGAGLIKLATTLANALAGTAIDITSTGTVYSTLTVAATDAIIDACLIDIPEFSTFVQQWVKCRCMSKDGDPRLAFEVEVLAQQRAQLNDTLIKGIDDDDDKIQMDMSHYNEMS